MDVYATSKKVVVMAVDKELIYKDPFRHYHIIEEESDRGLLTQRGSGEVNSLSTQRQVSDTLPRFVCF